MDFTHRSNNNQHIFTFSTHSYNRADFAPEPTSQKTTQPPKKKAKTGRTIDKLANFEYYRKKWITETSQDVAHDLTEADCEDIIDAFLGYQKWRKGGFLPMKVYWKVEKSAETRINNLVKQRLNILGVRTDGRHIRHILLK